MTYCSKNWKTSKKHLLIAIFVGLMMNFSFSTAVAKTDTSYQESQSSSINNEIATFFTNDQILKSAPVYLALVDDDDDDDDRKRYKINRSNDDDDDDDDDRKKRYYKKKYKNNRDDDDDDDRDD